MVRRKKRQLTLRYFVRSYVTRATTISAITEMPAKTPNPMGNTCSFFPGMANGAGDVLAFSAAAVPDDAAPAEVTECCAGSPTRGRRAPSR